MKLCHHQPSGLDPFHVLLILLITVITPQEVFAKVNVMDFGAVPDELTDNTQAFQKALDSASILGEIVFVPAGKYRIDGSLILKGVSLQGENLAPRSWTPLNGTVILATGGKNNESAPALFEMLSSSAVSGITVYYPEQDVDAIHPYPWTFHIGSNTEGDLVFDCTIENVTLINSYNGIHAGPFENGRHRISSVFGCVLRRGIFVESVGDIGRIENVQFHCHFWGHPETHGDFWKVFNFMQQNCEAFIFGRSDWEYVSNTFVFPAKTGYLFIHTENGAWSGECNGQFNGIGADACGCSIRAERIQHMGLLITNGQFNSHLTGDSIQVIVAENCEGSIRFSNSGFWGPVKCNVMIKGNAFVSFSNCYFSNNNENAGYSIQALNGNIQVVNCSFGAVMSKLKMDEKWTYEGNPVQPPAIFLGKNVKSAIITGNNGINKPEIINYIGKRARINNNLP